MGAKGKQGKPFMHIEIVARSGDLSLRTNIVGRVEDSQEALEAWEAVKAAAAKAMEPYKLEPESLDD